MFSSSEKFTDSEREVIKSSMEDMYRQFTEKAAKGRHMPVEKLRELAGGRVYTGRVSSIKDFGAFVEVFPGKDGLVHISELADFRVNRTEDVAKMGEMIWVKCIGIDDKGAIVGWQWANYMHGFDPRAEPEAEPQ